MKGRGPLLMTGRGEGVKQIRKFNTKSKGFQDLMSKRNRKQIPVCIDCLNKIHKGTYDGLSLKDWKRPQSKKKNILYKQTIQI
jgi:hypothetical protein